MNNLLVFELSIYDILLNRWSESGVLLQMCKESEKVNGLAKIMHLIIINLQKLSFVPFFACLRIS